MHIEDYVHPGDEYAPRPDASKRVAAQKRAQRLDDPEPLTPLATAIPARRYVPFGIGALVLIVLMIGAASYQLGQLPSALPLQITPVATQNVTSALVSVPTSAATETPAPRTISAYAAPDGVLLGQIEETRQITPVAHYGSDWIQADVAGSGLVWLRASDVPHLALTGPDLAPQPQTGRGLTLNPPNKWTPPESTPAPPADPATAPWPVSAPIAPDAAVPNIKEHLNAPRAPGQDG
jgi:hypothetical protein